MKQISFLEGETPNLNGKTLQRVTRQVAEAMQRNPELKPYYNLRDELTTVNNLILKSSKIAIPSKLINDMKQILRNGHLAIERTKLNAGLRMHWPNIEKDINEMIK